VRAKRQFAIDGILSPDGNYWMKGRTVIEEGQTFPADHPIVSKNRRDFTTV